MVTIGDSYQTILSTLGAPVEEKTDGVQRVLLYGSSSQTLADMYYVENNQLVVQSLSYYASPKSMQEYVDELGMPSYSIRKYDTVNDSFNTVVHLWPQAGRAVVTTGTDQQLVIREDAFASTSKEEYLATWGKDLVGHQEVAFASSSVELSPQVTYGEPQYSMTGWWAMLGVLAICVAAVVWRRRKSQER
jgi:hypothetical protein